MKWIYWLPVALLVMPALASAQTMNAEAFYQRSNKLMAKGPMAMFSPGEIKLLMNEVKQAGAVMRTRRLADEKAGRPARYCPDGGTHSMDSNEFMRRLSAIPAAERARIDMTEAMTRISAARFPCRH